MRHSFYRIDNLNEPPSFCDEANAELGEPHPDVWDLYSSITEVRATELLAKFAREINGLEAGSWEAASVRKNGHSKGFGRVPAPKMSPMRLCRVVHELDAAYNLGGANRFPQSDSNMVRDVQWLDDLWNCCDWCDDTWSFENSEHLVEEAKRALSRLSDLVSKPSANANVGSTGAP